jgi:hypothetical protein
MQFIESIAQEERPSSGSEHEAPKLGEHLLRLSSPSTTYIRSYKLGNWIEAELAIWDEPFVNLNCQMFANGDQKVLFH